MEGGEMGGYDEGELKVQGKGTRDQGIGSRD